MKRYNFVFMKGLRRIPRNGLPLIFLFIFLLSWFFFPAITPLFHPAYAARPDTPQYTPTPLPFSLFWDGVKSRFDSQPENSRTRLNQNLTQARNTPRNPLFQLLRLTQNPALQIQETPAGPSILPLESVNASIIGIKSVRPFSASIGERFRFSIELTNNSNDQVIDIQVTDDFPLFLDITRVQTTQNRGLVDVTNNRVKVFFQKLDPRQTLVIDIDAFVNDTAYGDFTFDNIAYFTYYYINTPFQGQTNAASYRIIAGGNPPPGGEGPLLVGQKTVSGSPAASGDSLGFFIEILNIGRAPAYNVLITDVFPSFLTITEVRTNPTRANVKVNQNQVEVSISPLMVNELLRITISTVVKQGVSGTSTNYNVAHFTYSFQNAFFSGYTNSALYQIGYSSGGGGGVGGLPPTGGREIESPVLPSLPISLVPGALTLFFGVIILVKKPWEKSPRLRYRNWLRSTSTALIVIGICLNLVACAQGESKVVQQLEPETVESDSISPDIPMVSTPTQAVPTAIPPSPTPSVLPDYPIPTPGFVSGSGVEEISFDISPIRRIVISSIDLDTIVKYVPFDGLSWKIAGLNTEVVWMGETSWPGLGGNTGLSAHVSLPDGSDGPFRRLVDLKTGDRVELYTEENIYIYTVRSQEIVPESDLSVLQSTDQSQITMITCADWDDIMQRYLNRLVVFSDLVDIQPLSQPKSSQ